MALKKIPNPVFNQEVKIPVPGEKPEKVEFEFFYKSKKDYDQFIIETATDSDVDSAAKIISGWALNDVFGAVSKDSIAELFNAYPGAPGALVAGYINGLHQGRLGN